MPDLRQGKVPQTSRRIYVTVGGMTEQREWRRSEARRLKPRPCPACGTGTEMPRWAIADPTDNPDPIVVVSRECTNQLCDKGPGFG